MAKYNNRASTTERTGFGDNSNNSGGRFYKPDGSPNITIKGISFLNRNSLYNTMLNVSTIQFLSIILLFYALVNTIFGTIYMLIGIEHLGGIDEKSIEGKFWESFFFSAQTLSTVGYGHVYPIGKLTNSIAAIESLIGLLAFALGTGLMYGRFSKPKAYIRYSRNALFAPYKGGKAIMFRLVPFKHYHLSNAEVTVTLVMQVEEDGILRNRFFPMELEIDKINSLTLSWTIVHAINEQSPFYQLTLDDLKNANSELLIFVRAFDESFSSTVISRTSYRAEDFIYGGKFEIMYHPSEDRSKTILELHKINNHTLVTLPD